MPKVSDLEQRFRLSQVEAEALVKEFGTPLYVMSEAHIRHRVRTYREALAKSWSRTEMSYASKANSTLAVLAIVASEGARIDVASEGELRAAMRAGISPSRCHMHGNNKSGSELRFAVEAGIGQIVADNFEELARLSDLGAQTEILLRLAPGVDPITHKKISTGQQDTKFGFNIANGSAERAVSYCQEHHLNLVGVHCHVGSQLLDPEAQRAGGEQIATFLVRMKEFHGVTCEYLNVGGGLGIRYVDSDQPLDIETYCRLIGDTVREVLEGTVLEPVLCHEPGRSLVGEAGVTLYQVGVVKDISDARRYVVVDGGLADNPRPALYESKYTVERLGGDQSATKRVRVSGRHCETDTLFDDIALPEDIKAGDIIQVLCTGAYNASMANNYNRYARPRAVMIGDLGPEIIQETDSWEEMFARERVPSRLLGGKG